VSTVEPAVDEERRLHPWSWLFVLVQQLRQFLLPLAAVVVFGSRNARSDLVDYAISGSVIAILVAVSVLQYLTYRYRIGSDSLSIRSGLLERNRREIPFARIHNVVVHQNLLHRMFGVAELRLESAGGDKPEAQMRVLKLDDALALEQLVRHRGRAPAIDAASAPAADELLALSTGEVIRLGLISNRGMVVVAAAIGATYQLFPRHVVEDFIEQQGRQLFGYANHLELGTANMALTGVVLLIAVLVLMRLLSIALAILQYHGFRLTESDRRLTVERGLLTRLRTSAARRRIQAWTMREGLLHRLFGRRNLRIDIAAGNAQDSNEKTLKELAPVATPAACDALIAQLLPQAHWPPQHWQAVSLRGWWRLCLPALIVLTLISTGLSYKLGGWGWLPMAWLPFSLFSARRKIQRMGYSINAQRVAVRGGWWRRWWRIAEVDKLQALQLSRSPLDRHFGTATLSLDTAGSSAGNPPLQLQFLPADEAQRLFDQLSGELAQRKLRW
jgi:putative membrane protein